MTVLFLKFVPRKYKLDDDHFSCSGENGTETARGAGPWAPLQALPPHGTGVLPCPQLRETPPRDADSLYWKLTAWSTNYWC